MSTTSTSRVQQYRQRQREAGNRRIALYIGGESRRKLEQLAGDKAQAVFIEELLKAAIEREWAARSRQPQDAHLAAQSPAAAEARGDIAADFKRFPGRRRSLASR